MFPSPPLARAAAALLVAFALPAQALRCDGGLVREGDHKVEVLDHCGEPAFRDRVVEYPTRVETFRGRSVVRTLALPLAVEEWVYDLGDARFRRLLRFRGNRLESIETLGRP